MLDPAPDPLDRHLDADHHGVACLRAAVDLLDANDSRGALAACRDARGHGVPSELVPYLALVQGVAALLLGDVRDGIELAGDAWRDHPDVAALPAVLGAGQLLAGESDAAARTMFAALVTDDADRSLEVHRRRLTQLLGTVRATSGEG
jgi:hypothetical protein